MRRLLSSLQVRLIVGFVAALALALSSVGLYVGYAADREVAQLRNKFTEAREARLKLALEEHYARYKGWYEVQPFLERVGPVYGKRLVLKDAKGQIVGDSRGDKKSFPPARGRSDRGITIHMPGDDPKLASIIADKKREIGELTVASDDLPESLAEPPLSRLSQAVNRSLLWAGLVAGGGGLLLVTMMSSSALAPVRTLTGAARRLGKGDLSQRVSVQREDEVGELAQTFNTMAEGMERAETQRRNLVADVAHELRSPLSNIQGTIEAMRDGLMDRGDTSLDMLHQQTLHLSHLVDDLGLLAMAEAGDLRLDIKPDSLEDAARRSVEAFRARAERRVSA
jgi:signal transduction histidine kinase